VVGGCSLVVLLPLCAFPPFAQPSAADADVSQRFAAPSKWAFRSFRTLRNTFRTHLHTRSKFEEFFGLTSAHFLHDGQLFVAHSPWK